MRSAEAKRIMPHPVLFIIQHLHQGGTEDHFHDLVRGIDRARFEPHVIHFNDREGGVARRIGADAGVRKTFLPVRRAYGLSGLCAIPRVRGYIRQHGIRAVVTYHFVADFIGTLAAWGRVPVVSSRRDTGFTRTPRQQAISPLLDRGVRHYIAVSGAVRAALIEKDRIAAGKITVIHNGIDAEALAANSCDGAAERARRGIGEDETVIACVANFNPVKCHAMLLEAFARLRGEGGIGRVRLLLAGDGPLRGAIENIIDALGLNASVILAGFSNHVSHEFQLADFAVLPSESEGLSNSLLQAMVFSRPVVACRVGGNPEVVVDGETGLLVPPHDPEAFAAAMGRLVRDPALRLRMGQAAARRVRDQFSIRSMLSAHEELLTGIIESARKS